MKQQKTHIARIDGSNLEFGLKYVENLYEIDNYYRFAPEKVWVIDVVLSSYFSKIFK